MSRETKTLAFQVKAEGVATNAAGQEVGLITAYGAMFGNIDEGNDHINPGSFKRTIQNSKARAKARNNKEYFLPMIWNHDTEHFMPIGGWYDASEDTEGLRGKAHVLLTTQAGRDYYELAKAGMVDQFSIIYEVMPGGATYDSKTGVRELTELRLYSIDPVVFAMNDETYLVSVKARDGLEAKTVCGNTSGPIGPRDESWSGSKAEKWIWSKALDDDDKVKPALAKKYFLRVDGDATLKGSYSYPFWIDDHISVGGVKACAGALSGARNADPGSDGAGMRRKVETLYTRINAKYKDDPLPPVPWKDDGKGSRMNRQMKTLQEHFNEEMAEDLLVDWQDVYLCSLTCAVCDALTIGDQPAADIAQALDDFKELVLSKFVPQAIECDLSDWLEEHSYSSNTGEYLMQYGNDSKPNYGYMSRRRSLSRKAGRAISAANGGKIQDAIDSLNDAADTHEKAMKAHLNAVRSAADDLATVLQGSEAAYGTDSGTPEDDEQEGKHRGTPSIRTRTPHSRSSSADTVSEKDASTFLSNIRALRSTLTVS